MVKAYNGALVLADVLLLILKILYYICESVYKFFVPTEEKSVVGEIVLITGAGHGIGKELALRYASLGATVVCWDLNQEANEETLSEIKKTGTTVAYAYQCDVSKREQVFSVAEKVKKEVGDVTILVNNAGIMPCHAFLDHTIDEIKRIFDINVLAHFWMLQAFLPSMIEKNHGHVVALSSLAGIGGLPNLVPYCASKFAVRGLMESISEELRISTKGKSLIKFTTIYPYMVDTGLCKKPKIKFPNAMPLVSPGQTASQIIRAQRCDYRERSVPPVWLPLGIMLRCNVADRKEVFRIAEKVRKEVSDVTILINNAGIGFPRTLLNKTADEITRVIDVNLKSHYWTLQAFLPSMIKKNHGHIVAVLSLPAFKGFMLGTVYCPTKSAVKALMEAISDELHTYSKGKSLIKFTTVFPALVLTGIIKNPRMRLLPNKTFNCIYDFVDFGCDIED